MTFFENITMYQWLLAQDPTKKDQETLTSPIVSQAPETIPLVTSPIQTTGATLNAAGNVPLVQTPPQDTGIIKGLSIETAAKTPANEPAEPAKPAENKQEEPKPEETKPAKSTATLDRQTMKFLGISQEKWDKLSDDEKQEKNNFAIKGMVDAYNKHQEEIGSKKRLTYAHQMELYRDRTEAGDSGQVTRLTGTVKSFHGKDQADVLKVSYQYKDAGNRELAEKTISNDYPSYDKENILVAAKETANFSENNQVIAANNAPKADVSLHKDLVDTYMTRDEKVQMALSNHVGEFGVGKDGQITDAGKEIQLACFKTINGSQYQSVIENSASNIYTMNKDNQSLAVKYVVSTGNEGAIKAAASQYANYDDSAKSDIATAIDNSGVACAQYGFSAAEPETQSTSSAKPTTSSTESAAVKEVKAIVDSGTVTNADKLKTALGKATDAEKLRILDIHSTNLDVIKAMLDLNPSSAVMAKIRELINQNNFNDTDTKDLMGKITNGTNDLNSSEVGRFSPALQKMYVEKLSPEKLKMLNPQYLDETAKAKYEERLSEIKKQEDTTGTKKFGILGRK